MKKILSLVASLTAICAVCAGVLAYVNKITKGPIAETAEKAKEAARLAVLCGEEGYAAEGRSGEGYGGDIVLMVGFTPDYKIVSYRKLEAAETPGLGANLTTEGFMKQFSGMDASSPIAVRKDGGNVEAITSATITSRAVCGAINNAKNKLEGLLKK